MAAGSEDRASQEWALQEIKAVTTRLLMMDSQESCSSTLATFYKLHRVSPDSVKRTSGHLNAGSWALTILLWPPCPFESSKMLSKPSQHVNPHCVKSSGSSLKSVISLTKSGIDTTGAPWSKSLSWRFLGIAPRTQFSLSQFWTWIKGVGYFLIHTQHTMERQAEGTCRAFLL